MYNNEQVWKFLGRISAETCLKMDSSKIAKRWGLRIQTPLPPAAGSFAPKTPFSLND